MPWLYVAVGGAAGAVNVAGSLVLGLVLALVPADDPRHLRPLLAVGFCGGLTTFSTFGYETVTLLQARAYGTAAAYAGASFAVALAAVVIGMWMGAQAR